MLWRTPSARSRRSPPAGFILPAQPTLVAKPPAGPEWIHEVKHDGYRLLALKSAGRVVLRSRHGTDFTDKLPRIAAAVRALPVDNALLDGEAVVFRPDGHSDFAALRLPFRRRPDRLRALRPSWALSTRGARRALRRRRGPAGRSDGAGLMRAAGGLLPAVRAERRP